MSVNLPIFTPTSEVLKESSALYNQLRDDKDQPDVPQHHLRKLASIFLRFNVEHIFGLHLLHGHLKIEQDMIMLGTQFENPLCWWTRPTKIQDINLKGIHGHIFKLSPDGRFLPYEYRTGPLGDMNLDHAFYQELAQYLYKNNLEELLGIQVLNDLPKPMAEIVFETGTAMLEASQMRFGEQGKITGWYVVDQDGIVDFKGNESHYPKPGEDPPHLYYYDGKMDNFETLVLFLEDNKII